MVWNTAAGLPLFARPEIAANTRPGGEVLLRSVPSVRYVNQRKVLANRAALVEMVYADPVPPGVIVAERTA
jgi:hypothetical protein